MPIAGICPKCHTSKSSFSKLGYSDAYLSKLYTKLNDLTTNKFNLDLSTQQRNIEKYTKLINEFLTTAKTQTGDVKDMKFIYKSKCDNSSCSVDNYHFDIRNNQYNIHYLVDPIRDAIDINNNNMNIVHIYGEIMQKCMVNIKLLRLKEHKEQC